MAFDTTRLVAQMTLKGALPDGRFEDQDLLDLAYDCLLSELVPAVLSAREEYYVTFQDVAVTANVARIPVPARAMNGVLREVKLVKLSGQVVDLDRIDLEDVGSTTPGTPQAFYLEGNSIVLHPTPDATSGDVVRLYFFLRPSKLVTVAECAIITAINGNVLSVTPPTGWSTGNTFDLVRGRAHFDVLGMDLAADTVDGSSITFTEDVPTTLQVGDYVALAEETCFPFLPPEGHVALVQAGVTSALESMGDAQSAATSAAKTASLIQSFKSVLSVRIQGAPKQLGTSLL